MATTVGVTLNKVFTTGDRKFVAATVTVTGDYITGGVPLTGEDLGLEYEVVDIDVGPAIVTSGIFPARYDSAEETVVFNVATDGTAAANEKSPELAAAAIPGGPATLRVSALGKGTAAA
jgi:hypothetical protein